MEDIRLSGLLSRLEQSISVFQRVVKDPKISSEIWKKYQARKTIESHREGVRRYDDIATLIPEGLSKLLCVSPSDVEDMLASATLLDLTSVLENYSGGGAGYVELAYAIARITRPRIVLETGVSDGYSSSALLQALVDNNSGNLFSVDLPQFRLGAEAKTGGGIPQHLRASCRWELVIGPDRKRLPDLVTQIAPIDFFHYDSDKSYEGMLHTWNLVWPYLRPGAVLMLDDVNLHDAFFEFADEKNLTPIVIHKPRKMSIYQWDGIYSVGLLRKPE